MKLKLNELTIAVISVVPANNTLRIEIEEEVDKNLFLSQLSRVNTLVYTDDEGNVVQTFEGIFSLNSMEEADGSLYYNLQMTNLSSRAVSTLKESITNIELALCEIYESMGV